MKEILEIYKVSSEEEKIILKELLNDFLIYVKEIENKSKSYFLNKEKEEFTEYIKKEFYKIINWFQKEIFNYSKEKIKMLLNLITEEIKEINRDIFWEKYNEKTHKIIFIEIYKWEINQENNNLFYYRRSIINLLAEKNIIYISKFNASKEFKKIMKWEYEKELQNLVDIWDKYLKKQKDIFWEDVIKYEEQKLLNWEKKMEFITFNLEEIQEILKKIENIDNKKITFEKWWLDYNWKIYIPKKYSDRYKFLELFFSNEKTKWYKKSEILNYLENWAWDFYNEKQRKRILDLYNWLNTTIEKKLWIKKLFELWKNEFEEYIFINI